MAYGSYVGTLNEAEARQYCLESGVFRLLKNQSMGVTIDVALAEQLLHNPHEELDKGTKRLGEMLFNHPIAVEVLLKSLFCPGSMRGRLKSLDLKLKCAKIIASATLTSEAMLFKLIPSEELSEEEKNQLETGMTEQDLAKVNKETHLTKENA